MVKSLFLTYAAWLFGGFFGLHHFYLGRDRHCLIWLMLPGGYFGLGWIRDLWRIPEYVKHANSEPQYLDKLTTSMRRHPRPPSSSSRLCGQIIFADTLGYLSLWALPVEWLPEWTVPFCAVGTPLAIAFGIHIVGNIGNHRSSLFWPVCGAYITYPLYFYSLNSVLWTSLVSSALFNNYGKEWRRTPSPKRSVCLRASKLAVALTLYLALLSSAFYFSCEFTDNNGDVVKCRDAVRNFFTSKMWQEFKSVMWDIYEFAKYNGWWEIWNQILEALDPQGEANALKVLNLTAGVSEKDLQITYRKLSRQWHPDRFKDQQEKQVAQDKFIDIQKAYETLSAIKLHRLKRNKENRENP